MRRRGRVFPLVLLILALGGAAQDTTEYTFTSSDSSSSSFNVFGRRNSYTDGRYPWTTTSTESPIGRGGLLFNPKLPLLNLPSLLLTAVSDANYVPAPTPQPWRGQQQNRNFSCPDQSDHRFRDTDGEPLVWPSTIDGESALPIQACLDKNLQPVERPCLRDTVEGAKWGDPTGECEKNLTSASTSSLLRMAKLSVTPENAASVTRDLASALRTSDNPSTADVALVADALVKISRVSGSLTASSIDDLTSLMDGVLKSSVTARSDLIDKDVEATSSILSSVDKILENLQLDSVPEGMAQSFSSRAALLVADVERSGVTGIAALAAEDESKAFSAVRPLRQDDKLEKDSLEISARLLGGQSKGRASFVLVGTRRVFPQRDEQVHLNSRVVGVTLTGGKEDSHGTLIEFEVRPLGLPGQGFARKCAFWDLKAGEWSTEGCKLVRHDKGTGRDVCQCTHLTHFGEIIGVGVESAVLDVISLVGCVLSLLGLMGISLTAIFFKQWRSRLGNKILLHLSFSIGLTMVAFLGIALGGASGGAGHPACIFLGVLMHYSVLASFCWMLVSASLQLLRFVVVISARPPHFLLKGVLVGWVVPIVPVFVLLALGPAQSYGVAGDEGGFCYPHGIALVIAVILPVAIAVIANLIFFCIIIYRVSCGRDKRLQTNMSAMSESRMAIRQLKMSVLLFFLLGLSWIFGIFALLLPKIKVWQLIFSYLFCATATLQGLALFLFFVAWERKARALWLATLPEAIGKRGATSDSTSGVSPSTGTMSGTRTDDEAVPLKQRGSTATQPGGRPVSNIRATKSANSVSQLSQK